MYDFFDSVTTTGLIDSGLVTFLHYGHISGRHNLREGVIWTQFRSYSPSWNERHLGWEGEATVYGDQNLPFSFLGQKTKHAWE